MDQDRKMYEGNWQCAGCGKPINKLPFEPRDTSNLKCLDCFKQSAPARPQAAPGGERQMFQGDWKCSGCGGSITQLPFQPRDESNLTCRECFLASRN